MVVECAIASERVRCPRGDGNSKKAKEKTMEINRIDIDNLTLGEWLLYWFETYKKPCLKPYSIRNIEQQIRLHTPEWFKAMRLKDITLLDADRALSTIPLGRTRKYTRQVWHSACKKAQQLGLIDKNVFTLTEDMRYKEKKSHPLTIAEQKEFLERLESSRYKWLMLFYLHTGVRRAEALTLKWEDIDYDSRLIRINGTKTDDSYRHILLTEPLIEILAERKKQAKKEGVKSEYVFPCSLSMVSRAFKKLCPNHHLHELRHTFVTRCAECGVNMSVCQQLVGHSTADMTINVYMHVMDEFKRKEGLKFKLFPTL